MIFNYRYCGIQDCANGSKRIWGAATWVANGYTDIYLFWGSPTKPLVKRYVVHSKMPRSERLASRIANKQKWRSGYREIQSADVSKHLPDLESQIGMHILSKKLRFG